MSRDDRWEHVDALLKKALDREPDQREEFLSTACGGDEALRWEVERLLELAGRAGDPLEPGGGAGLEPMWEAAALELAEPGSGELAPGQRLGPYEIRGLLGEGGMGRVYRGWDTGLGRSVALKALAETFAGAPESLRRFEREAKLLAALNHPNIASIYELLAANDQKYLVLELVEGETLEERLARGPLAFEETVRVARQLADALEEAHRKGVIHRDLKPTNVMIAPGGRVKVLDFGLAKAESRDPDEPTTLHTTRSGVVLGTAAYMSPEQARGEAVDRRTDVWGFGCLLYEMLTGERVFKGRSGPDILAAVLRDPVDFGRLPENTPSGLRRLVRRCLQKELNDRLQDIGDARLELADLPAQTTAELRPARAFPGRRAVNLAVPWVVATLAIAVAIVSLVRDAGAPREAPSARRLDLLPGPGLELVDDFAPPFALSRDGRRVVYRARAASGPVRLWLRELDSPDAHPVEDTDEARQPFFSPDGRSLGFFADRKLKVVSLEPPAAARTLLEVGGNPRGASWSERGVILVAPSQTSGLLAVDADSGEARELTRLDPAGQERSHRWPYALPGGELALFTVQPEGAGFDDARIEAVRISDGTRHVVAEGGSHPVWSASGHLVFARQGRLLAARLDPHDARREGDAVPVLDGVAYGPRNGGAGFAVADDGTLIYRTGPVTSLERRLVWVDAAGRLTPLDTEPRRFSEPRLSPDGGRIAVRIGAGNAADVWVLDVPSGTLTQLSFGAPAHRPVWGPAGDSVTWSARVDGRWRILSAGADAAGSPRTLVESDFRIYPDTWTPDGSELVYQERHPETGWDLRRQRFDSEGQPAAPSTTLLARPFNEEGARISPDGRWLAYESDELDAVVEVYVRPMDHGGPAIRITTGGARAPLWGADGSLYAWRTDRDRLLRAAGPAIRIAADPEGWTAGDVRPVWDGTPAEESGPVEQRVLSLGTDGGDIDPEHRRFLLLAPPRADATPAPSAGLAIVLGWGADLQRRLP